MAGEPVAAPELIELSPSTPSRYMSGDVEITSNPDGSELINLNGADESELSSFNSQDPQDFNANLAESMSASQRYALAARLIEYHRVDLSSREDWEQLTRQALVLLGIEKIDATRLPFAGAAAMQHPVIAEACTQFNANAIAEFFPATGPVKGKAAGEQTPEIAAQVMRAQDYMNFYLTLTDKGYYADTDQMLFYLPIAGSVFRKTWVDPRNGMPRARYIKAEDFVAPYFARDLENCPRYCHQYQMTGSEIRRGMQSGEFLKQDLPRPPMEADELAGSKIEDRSDRRTRALHEDDELYDVLEYHVEMALTAGVDELDQGEIDLPYVITVDKTSQEILAVRRNWKETDPQYVKRIWFTHYKFLPGLGFYGWGFLHVIGSLAEAISGSVRVLLDSALMATLQGGFRAKDGAKNGGSVFIEPGKWKDIDCSYEELQKTFYTPPFKEPSAALPNLLQALVQDARRFASLTEVVTGQANNKAPVGTTLALIEQSLKLFTAIHKRIFNAAQQEFEQLAQLLHDYGPDERYPYYLEGKAQEALREDFDDRVDFIPVADPNIISDVQRISLAQAVLEVVMADPQSFGPEQKTAAYKRFFIALKVPNHDELLPKQPSATYLDPVGENQLMLVGKPVRAYPGQRHDLHLQVHQRAAEIAKNTMPADQFQAIYAVFGSHQREHMALQMAEQISAAMQQSVGAPLPPTDIYGINEDQPPQLEMAVSIAAAQALPPIPPPQPGSAGDSAAQGDPGAAKAAAEQERLTVARDAETMAKIERETAAFAATQQREKLEHDQRLAFEATEHDAKMRQMDEEAAAKILRENAHAKLAIAHDHTARSSKLEAQTKTDEAKLKAQKAAAAAKPKPKAKKKANGGSH